MNERGVSFYCKDCRLDQDIFPRKEKNRFVEWFSADCRKCGENLIRYITNKHLDPYYYNSLELRKQRNLLAKELIQPGDSRFKKYYRTEYDKLELTAQKLEERKEKEKADRDDFYSRFKYATPTMRKIVKNVLEVEERM